jgi:hypothetical protein
LLSASAGVPLGSCSNEMKELLDEVRFLYCPRFIMYSAYTEIKICDEYFTELLVVSCLIKDAAISSNFTVSERYIDKYLEGSGRGLI